MSKTPRQWKDSATWQQVDHSTFRSTEQNTSKTPRERLIHLIDTQSFNKGEQSLDDMIEQAILAAVPLIVEMAREKLSIPIITNGRGNCITDKYLDAESIIKALRGEG